LALLSLATRPEAVPLIVERPVLVSAGPVPVPVAVLPAWPGFIALGSVVGELRSCSF
jgi:hypothetical protein